MYDSDSQFVCRAGRLQGACLELGLHICSARICKIASTKCQCIWFQQCCDLGLHYSLLVHNEKVRGVCVCACVWMWGIPLKESDQYCLKEGFSTLLKINWHIMISPNIQGKEGLWPYDIIPWIKVILFLLLAIWFKLESFCNVSRKNTDFTEKHWTSSPPNPG